MFTASWFGIGHNYGSLRINGDVTRYAVRWGDGSNEEAIRSDLDDDGNPFGTTAYGHDYAGDGDYDVRVSEVGSGSPAIRLKAFLHDNAIVDVSVAGSRIDDLIVGGSGNDRLSGRAGHDTISGGEGDDVISGGDDADFLVGGLGADFIRGDDGNDLITSDEGDDRVDGGAGQDNIFGGDGNDTLLGGDGNDSLAGGAGVDRLYGGAGADIFQFGREGDARRDPARDVVLDFVHGTDRLSVGGWSDQNFAFIGQNAFHAAGTSEVRMVIDGRFTTVFGDADGNGTVDFSFKVAGAPVLEASDFFL